MGFLVNGPAFSDEAWLERSGAILEEARRQPLPDWLRNTLDRKPDLAGIKRPTPEDLGLSPPKENRAQGPVAYIYVSFSMETETLKAILQENRGHRDRVMVFRGLPEGQSLKAFAGSFKELLAGINRHEIPPIAIDPERFQRHGISRVPAITLEHGNELQAMVQGIHQVDWLERRRVSDKSIRNFGVRGETTEIQEPDLMERVKARFRTFDWAGYQREARETFWQQTRFEALPEAKIDRVFWMDPTVTAPHDIQDDQGRTIVPAGHKVNPLDTLPFHQKLIIFNPTRVGQVTAVQKELKQAPKQLTLLIATEIDRSGGWKTFQELQQKVGTRVYLLTPDIRKRFKLETVPTVVEAEGRQFRMREVGMEYPK